MYVRIKKTAVLSQQGRIWQTAVRLSNNAITTKSHEAEIYLNVSVNQRTRKPNTNERAQIAEVQPVLADFIGKGRNIILEGYGVLSALF